MTALDGVERFVIAPDPEHPGFNEVRSEENGHWVRFEDAERLVSKARESARIIGEECFRIMGAYEKARAELLALQDQVGGVADQLEEQAGKAHEGRLSGEEVIVRWDRADAEALAHEGDLPGINETAERAERARAKLRDALVEPSTQPVPSPEGFEEAVEKLAARQFEWTIRDRDAMPCSWADCGKEARQEWLAKARTDLEALPFLQQPQPVGRLSEEENDDSARLPSGYVLPPGKTMQDIRRMDAHLLAGDDVGQLAGYFRFEAAECRQIASEAREVGDEDPARCLEAKAEGYEDAAEHLDSIERPASQISHADAKRLNDLADDIDIDVDRHLRAEDGTATFLRNLANRPAGDEEGDRREYRVNAHDGIYGPFPDPQAALVELGEHHAGWEEDGGRPPELESRAIGSWEQGRVGEKPTATQGDEEKRLNEIAARIAHHVPFDEGEAEDAVTFLRNLGPRRRSQVEIERDDALALTAEFQAKYAALKVGEEGLREAATNVRNVLWVARDKGPAIKAEAVQSALELLNAALPPQQQSKEGDAQ
ncbi:MAG TPA: hypothetical protein VMS11_07340 [Solirubrobacterales bacterium]|nr:hypothetical protein [Solirubrobacterales bacterium]